MKKKLQNTTTQTTEYYNKIEEILVQLKATLLILFNY